MEMIAQLSELRSVRLIDKNNDDRSHRASILPLSRQDNGGLNMKKICSLFISMLLLTALFPTLAFAEGEGEEPATPVTPAMTTGSVSFSIDDRNRYKGMEKAYRQGYMPVVKGGKALIVLPLIASGELLGDTLTATPQLGDPASSPFVIKNYQITVRQKNNRTNDSASTVSSYLVSLDLSLKPDRVNGVYQVIIDIKGRSKTDNSEVMQSFTTYVTITDGRDLAGNEVPPVDAPDSEKPSSQPKVIVKTYAVSSSPVIAGQEFTVKITLENTNKEKAVQNMTVDVSCESPNLTLMNESSSIFVGNMAQGATREIELRYKTDLETPAQNYNIILALSYDDAKAVPLTSAGIATITVDQALRVKMGAPQIAKEANAGDTMPLTIQVMNLGHSKIYNARVELSAPGLLPVTAAFVGNLEAGTAMDGMMNVFVGAKDMSEGYEGAEKYGYTTGTLTLIYEDANGQEFTDSLDISTTINEPTMNTANAEEKEKPKTVSQWWVSVTIALVVLGALAAVLTIRHKNAVK
jgi:hypothetical protein